MSPMTRRPPRAPTSSQAAFRQRTPPAGGYSITFVNRGYVETEDQYDAGIFRYDLVAREPQSGVAVARATCAAEEKGAVTAMSIVPLTVEVSSLAADR